jgi:hypothetical protein
MKTITVEEVKEALEKQMTKVPENRNTSLLESIDL